ncbi:MAG: phosphoribosyl-AMP cyclohydrolase [Acidobacteriota bacterium]
MSRGTLGIIITMAIPAKVPDGLTRNSIHATSEISVARRASGGFFVLGTSLSNTSEDNMQLDFKKLDGLVAAVIQDWKTNEVLMVGFMNEEAFQKTVETGFAVFYSRTRNKLWLKGETSGHRLVVKDISTDCDLDTVLLRVEAQGPGVCHEGYQSCFFRQLQNGEWKINAERAYDPAQVYGN